jgi:hypothetical protein
MHNILTILNLDLQPSSSNRRYRKKTLSSVSTTMTKAQSIFITHPQPLLDQQQDISIIIPPPPSTAEQELVIAEHSEEHQQETHWESNDQALNCRRCHKWFTFLVRRHHCRKCGQIICNSCSQHRVYLPPSHIIHQPNSNLFELSSKPQRICDVCIQDVENSDIIKRNKRASKMMECPVCNKNLQEYETMDEQEEHVQTCLSQGSSSNMGIRFVGKLV